jgi:hypothetical protein
MKDKIKIINVNNKTYKLSLEYVFGFWEGDGSITIQLKPNSTHKTGRRIILIFEIHQHTIDLDLLTAISIYLGCGKVEVSKKLGNKETWLYRLRISTQTEILNTLLPILQSQTMMLNKREHDIQLFIKSCLLVKNKKHLNVEGQKEISNISSQLSGKLDWKTKLKKLTKINNNKVKSETNLQSSLNNERITGFTDAEGNFYFTLVSSKLNPNYKGVNFNFNISQEKSEIKFLNELVKFFGCGNVFTDEKGGGRFVVNNKKDLVNKIIPFFEVNELQTIKKHSFFRFKKALEICTINKPLLSSHIEELKSILLEQIGKRPKK